MRSYTFSDNVQGLFDIKAHNADSLDFVCK